jgi:hypothetical protein
MDSSVLNENNNNSDTLASYVLTASANTCSHVVIAGSYKKDTITTVSNSIAVDVTVNKTGTWKCYTDTVSGIWFDGSGTFATTGQKTITLQAHGKPIKDGQINFVIHGGSTSCSFNLTVYAGLVNIPPVADAGKDTTITLPANIANLNGNATDADGTVTSFQWSKVGGPATFNITNANQAITQATGLIAGTYQFELAVTDNNGAIAKDTMVVTVKTASVLSGSLLAEQTVFGTITPINDNMVYDAAGNIIEMNSTYHANLKMYYNANNKLTKREVYFANGSGNGTWYLGEYYEYNYDANGNVSSIDYTSNPSTKNKTLFQEFTWNSDNTIKTKKTYSGSLRSHMEYVYTNGNLTSILDYAGCSSNCTPFATYNVTYDTRENKFNAINPQFYFISTQTTVAETDRSEIFFFSKNYPTSFYGIPVFVTTLSSTDLKPYTVSFYSAGQVWYKYIYAL